jgi:hypothetical protein
MSIPGDHELVIRVVHALIDGAVLGIAPARSRFGVAPHALATHGDDAKHANHTFRAKPGRGSRTDVPCAQRSEPDWFDQFSSRRCKPRRVIRPTCWPNAGVGEIALKALLRQRVTAQPQSLGGGQFAAFDCAGPPVLTLCRDLTHIIVGQYVGELSNFRIRSSASAGT